MGWKGCRGGIGGLGMFVRVCWALIDGGFCTLLPYLGTHFFCEDLLLLLSPVSVFFPLAFVCGSCVSMTERKD